MVDRGTMLMNIELLMNIKDNEPTTK